MKPPISISARPIRDADRIIVLHDGIVAEQGTHDELLALAGVYAALHRARIAPAGSAVPRDTRSAGGDLCPAV